MTARSPLHVILGAGGAIGRPLAQELLARGTPLRTVSRTGHGPEGAEIVRADLLDADDVLNAVGDGATVHLLAGLAYDRRVWADQWPRIMRNVIDACAAKQARLVFFDNVYLYGSVDGPMTEETPVRPSSRKGTVRAEIVRDLEDAIGAGRVTAAVARAADFYGPHAEKTSPIAFLVLQKLAAGKRAQILVDADTRHSYTYTSDAVKALTLIAEADDAFGQAWHLPTARPALTHRQIVELAARELGVAPRLTVAPRWVLEAAGVFSTLLREVAEMTYQNEHDYLFDSSKFERRFGVAPTTYEDGIRATVKGMRQPQPPPVRS